MLNRLIRAVIVAAMLAYGAAAAYMGLNQRSFIYKVDARVPEIAASGVARAQPITLARPDDVMLTGWHVPPKDAASPVIVYFHGNAGTLMRRAGRFQALTEGGAGLIAFHYRGYGGSGGAPTEALLHADAAAILAEAERLYPGHQRVIFGESLGSGVASRLASEHAAAALILDSPFLSVLERARSSYPWLPVGLLLVDPFRSDLVIGKVRMPVLILHGARDRVVPIEDGERLHALANEPKRFVRFEEAGHVGAFRFGAMAAIRSFLKDQAGLML